MKNTLIFIALPFAFKDNFSRLKQIIKFNDFPKSGVIQYTK